MIVEERRDIEETVNILRRLDADGLRLINASGEMLAAYQSMVRKVEEKQLQEA